MVTRQGEGHGQWREESARGKGECGLVPGKDAHPSRGKTEMMEGTDNGTASASTWRRLWTVTFPKQLEVGRGQDPVAELQTRDGGTWGAAKRATGKG